MTFIPTDSKIIIFYTTPYFCAIFYRCVIFVHTSFLKLGFISLSRRSLFLLLKKGMESGSSSSLGLKKNRKKTDRNRSSSLGLKKNGKKTDRNCHAWTPMEELVLVGLMKDLVTNGWKSKNGFKRGYLQKLEKGMMRKLPGTDIRAENITSRVTIWKKFHGSLQTMLTENSGIGFNTATHTIDCHNDAWARIIKADPNATNMRYKSWPLFEEWKEIFGMERANGVVAEDIMQLHGADKIYDVIGQFDKSSDVRIDNLVRAIGYDFDVGKARKEVFSVLDGMADIDEDEKVDVAHWFGKNANCLEVFMGMTDSGRARYVRRLLSGQLN
ncbi:hypothetical protein ACS0TY_034811 [Phlomoides rotata]